MCKPVLLIGMMGCGKSTIGRLLAGRMGLPLIDLDEEIAYYCSDEEIRLLTDDELEEMIYG